MIDLLRRVLWRGSNPQAATIDRAADTAHEDTLTAEEQAAVKAAAFNAVRRKFLKRASRPG